MGHPYHRLVPILFVTAALAACGGGDDGPGTEGVAAGGGTNTGSPGTVVADSGSVKAPYQISQAPRYALLSIGATRFGGLKAASQSPSGAVTSINGEISLSGGSATREISGDAGYAQGRWVKGTVTDGGRTATLDGVSNAAYHYVLFNGYPSGRPPTGGKLTCDAGRFTAPSYIGGANVPASAYAGSASGTATLMLLDGGSDVSIALEVAAGGSSGKVNASATLADPAKSVVVGNFFGGNNGAQLAIGIGADGVLVVAPYKVTLANGAAYQGIASFNCRN
ncbi:MULTISPECIES: hypothetical protein [Cupriavidus]